MNVVVRNIPRLKPSLLAGLEKLGVATVHEANARKGPERLAHLQAADASLNKLRLYLRLSRHWDWLSSGQYEHVSRMVAEIGKLLGGWLKQTKGRA